MHTHQTPLVSAVCCSGGRPRQLERAIECFLAQTYSRKELLVAYAARDVETRAVIDRHARHPAVIGLALAPEEARTRGEFRNQAVEASGGDFICAWEEQDWHHCERIEAQLEAVRRMRQAASVLSNVLLFDATERAYFSHFRPWESTVLVRRETFESGLRYPELDQLEDTHFVRALVTQSRLIPVVTPGLYIHSVAEAAAARQASVSLFLKAAQPLSPDASSVVAGAMTSARSVRASSELLRSAALLSEYKYFYLNNITGTQRHIEAYRRSVSTV
jgi:hypothetical protein